MAVAEDEWEDVDATGTARVREVKEGTTTSARREICHLRVGRLNLTRRWWMDGYEIISRVPPPLVLGAVMATPIAGLAAGWALAQWTGLRV